MDSFKKFARMSVTDKIAELMSTLLKCGVTSSQLRDALIKADTNPYTPIPLNAQISRFNSYFRWMLVLAEHLHLLRTANLSKHRSR